MSSFEERYRRTAGTPAQWDVIREAYDFHLPDILEARSHGPRGRTSPYFIDWKFTPIEEYAWHDIRSIGVPLYPQFPVDRYFIDFADPYLKIGVELDGKDFHSPERDRPRDERLWALGWRIYRIAGRNSLPEPRESADARMEMPKSERDFANRAWGMRWSEGFFWALNVTYYKPTWATEENKNTAYMILDAHRLIDFPVLLDGDEE